MAITKTKNALADGMALTAKGALTHASSGKTLLDLYFLVGASRGKDLTPEFEKLHGDYTAPLAQIMFWARDVRGGAGERQVFRSYLKWVADNHPADAVKIVSFVPEYGRWDDLIDLLRSDVPQEVRLAALNTFSAGLTAGNGLCAKWLPRKGFAFDAMRNHLNLTPKAYRKLIVGLSKTVEQQMCAKQWSEINYSHVPSVAAGRYQKAFNKRDKERYGAYREALKSDKKEMPDGTKVKINATAVFPHDVLRSAINGDGDVAQAQWEALDDLLKGGSAFPICDTSGSMSVSVSGSITAWDISVALGLYVAERAAPAFKDMLMVFSSDSKVLKPKGNLKEKYKFMKQNCPVGYTNLQSAFDALLSLAVKSGATDEDMPKALLIMSDMNFDQGCTDNRRTNHDVMAQKFAQHGYTLPKVVYWNLNAGKSNVPVQFNKEGVVLISGYSPSILKQALGVAGNPSELLDKAVFENPRYEAIGAALA